MDAEVCNSATTQLSRRAAKKVRRKQLKAEQKQKALEAYLTTTTATTTSTTAQVETAKPKDSDANNKDTHKNIDTGGKAARARLARQEAAQGICTDIFDETSATKEASSSSSLSSSWTSHRPQGGAPLLSQTLPQHLAIVEYLENLEATLRIRGRGQALKERAIVPVDCHGSFLYNDPNTTNLSYSSNCVLDLSNTNLKGTFHHLPTKLEPSTNLLHLNLSNNQLWALAVVALAPLVNLQSLDISRNYFDELPPEINCLKNLQELRATHNLLKFNSLHVVGMLATLSKLHLLDIRFNQNVHKQSHLESLQTTLGATVTILMTVTYPPPPSSTALTENNLNNNNVSPDKVGASPAERNATLLRSQLEPWSSMALRRRLMADFGDFQTTRTKKSWADPEVTRGPVMARLLELYKEEAETTTTGGRTIVHVEGVPVEESICDRILAALKTLWSKTKQRERPSICAQNYMILCSPSTFAVGSQKAAKAAQKLQKHQDLWNLAQEAMKSVDVEYASLYTAVAVTRNFVGSPHIDKQNIGPFYGFSVGDFADGTGGIMVECSARVVANVNTKNRMGKVDGRYPHWVAPYDHANSNRYSLIYYRTAGKPEPIGPAIFVLPQIK